MRRASRGRLERPLSVREEVGKEASAEVVVGCEGCASLLGPVVGGSWVVCCDGVASMSAILMVRRRRGGGPIGLLQ